MNIKYVDVNHIAALTEYGISDIVVAIGIFDGIHKGHQILFDELIKMGKELNADPVAVTFFPHPKEILSPNTKPGIIIPQNEKIRMIHHYGIKAVVTIPFTRNFAELSPEEFIDKCLQSKAVNLRGICVGQEWKFGNKGKGNYNTLKKYAERGHFKFCPVKELLYGDKKVSSTSIRRAVANGELELAKEMLGRYYSLYGTIECGRKIAGSKLSHPTANLKINNGIIPPDGVYAAIAKVGGKEFKAAAAIGVSPTFRHEYALERRVEVHLLDYEGSEIYGEKMEVTPLQYIREERTFGSIELLKEQIVKDIAVINNCFDKYSSKSL